MVEAGSFGKVWKATWQGTPIAVKVLTGSAQANLEAFKAETNLLKVSLFSLFFFEFVYN